MSVERVEISSKPATKEAVIATHINFWGTSFSLIKTSLPQMENYYNATSYRLETKPDKKPVEVDLADNLTRMEESLTRQKEFAERVQYLYASLAGVAGLGSVFALLASNLKDAPQMALAAGLTATAGLFFRKLDRVLKIETKTNDKLNFLTRVKPQ